MTWLRDLPGNYDLRTLDPIECHDAPDPVMAHELNPSHKPLLKAATNLLRRTDGSSVGRSVGFVFCATQASAYSHYEIQEVFGQHGESMNSNNFEPTFIHEGFYALSG